MSRVVFVGNIPYDMTEEQLIDIFSAVGPVVGFRLVFDRDSGKAKGFGFCEFQDHETAASAVRNLNGHDVKGRPLRIDLADSDPLLEGKTTNRGELEGGIIGASHPGNAPKQSIPKGVPVPPGSNPLDMISNVIAGMPPNQMMDILGHMKGLVLKSPEQAQTLLQNQPQLAYALFQAMLMNNIVDPAVLQRMLAQTAAPNRPGPPPSQPPPHTHTPQAPPMAVPPIPPPFFTGPPPAAALLPPYQQTNLPPAAALRPQYQQYPPQAPAPPPPAAPTPAPATNEEQKAMIMQLLSLTPAQMDVLPPAEKAAVLALRAQLGQMAG